MGFKTLVAVTNINNLSDARYCAGMGVDIIGFNLSQGNAGAVQPGAVKEIAGWLAGVKIAGQFQEEPIETVNDLIADCGLHLVQLNALYLLDEIESISVPVIMQITINKDTDDAEMTSLLQLYQEKVRYFLITSDDFTAIDETNKAFLAGLTKQFPILLGFGLNKENINQILTDINPAGIALQGGHEIKPGLKEYNDLEEIFEVLED